MELVVKLLCRFAANNHTICDHEYRPIGAGCYVLGGMVNHSCEPNTVQTFSGCRIGFRTLRPVRKGDEVTISYVDLAATRQARLRDLERRYLFRCNCGRCTSPVDPSDHLKTALLCTKCAGAVCGLDRVCEDCGVGDEDGELARRVEVVDSAIAAATHTPPEELEGAAWPRASALVSEQTRAGGDMGVMRRDWQAAVDAVQRALHPCNLRRLRVTEVALELCLREGAFAQALPLADASVKAYCAVYPADSPLTALQHCLLGKLELNNEPPLLESAAKHFERGLLVLRRSHGADNTLVRQMEGMLRETTWAIQGQGAFDTK